MNELILYCIIIGVVINLLTMLNKEIREYWFEWGVLGFVVQMIFSTIFFPLIAYVITKERFTQE